MIARDFSLRFTAESGQPLAFYSDYSRGGDGESLRYTTELGVIDVHAVRKPSGETRISHSFSGGYTRASAEAEVKRRLGLHEDMDKVYRSIDTDAFMHSAITELRGLRLTGNPPWEATLTFLVSQFNNIGRIRLIMRRLISAFGEEATHDGKAVRLFPAPDALASASIRQLMECNTGFRARYIKSVAEEWQTFDYKDIYRQEYAVAKRSLMELDGIGEKVADCILLMGYGKLEAFPVDVWIQRVVGREYLGGKGKPRQVREFAAGRWGAYAGYAQQYLFWYGRITG